MNDILFKRSASVDETITYRKLSIESDNGKPKTLNEENRTIKAIAVTDGPVRIYDWRSGGYINEHLLMSGVELPGNGQVPLLDSHDRWSTDSVIGSFRNFDVKKSQIEGEVHFSSLADEVFTKYKEGDLTDFSIGYRTLESVIVAENEKQTIDGKIFKGPVRVTTRWSLHELSAVAVGADPNAKARQNNEQNTERATATIKKEIEMDEKTRKILESRGLPAEATEADAWRFMESLDIQNDAQKIDLDAEKARAAKEAKDAERQRQIEIDALCERHSMPDGFKSKMKADEVDIQEVRNGILEELARQDKGTNFAPAKIAHDQVDKFRGAAEDALCIRESIAVENPNPGARDLAGFSLTEICREALKAKNLNYGGNKKDMIGRAMVTSDFPLLLANVAKKTLFEGFENRAETWNIWCDTGSVSDFKTNYLPRVSEADTLVENPEMMPGEYGSFTEAQESYSIATYRKMWAFSRQMIINDDLSAAIRMVRSMGEAASRTIGNIAYAVLTANAAMGDGLALFVAGHSNLASVAGLPGVATMNAAELAMMTQTDEKGLQVLNIMPNYIILPAAQKGASEVFFRSERYADSDTIATDSSLAATRVNTWSGDRVQRVYDARLDASSTTAWYLAGPKGKTVTVFFLDGKQTPTMETQAGWSVQGVEYDIYIDAGAKAVSWKALYKNAGA